MAQIDRTEGLVGNTAIKAPCAVSTTAEITLSGEQTIDGVLTSASRVLVKNQANTVQNGIWVSDSGAWNRAQDFDGTRDATTGTLVYVNGGTTGTGFWYVSTAGDPVPGTDAIAFTVGTSLLASQSEAAAAASAAAAEAAAIAISWEGAWVTSTAYAVDNIVSNNGSSYICVEAHTSSVFVNDLSAARWEVVAQAGASGLGSGDMLAANNLSDVANAATSRTNIGAQATLVSNTNIKTVNGATLLGSGEALPVPGTSGNVLTSDGTVWTSAAAPADSAWELVSTTSVTAVASIDFDLQEDVYCEWKFVLDNIIPATDGASIRMRPGYAGTFETVGSFTLIVDDSATVANAFAICGTVGSTGSEAMSANITIGPLSDTRASRFICHVAANWISDAAANRCAEFVVTSDSTTPRLYDAVRFIPSAGSFEASGTIKMYGLKRNP